MFDSGKTFSLPLSDRRPQIVQQLGKRTAKPFVACPELQQRSAKRARLDGQYCLSIIMRLETCSISDLPLVERRNDRVGSRRVQHPRHNVRPAKLSQPQSKVKSVARAEHSASPMLRKSTNVTNGVPSTSASTTSSKPHEKSASDDTATQSSDSICPEPSVASTNLATMIVHTIQKPLVPLFSSSASNRDSVMDGDVPLANVSHSSNFSLATMSSLSSMSLATVSSLSNMSLATMSSLESVSSKINVVQASCHSKDSSNFQSSTFVSMEHWLPSLEPRSMVSFPFKQPSGRALSQSPEESCNFVGRSNILLPSIAQPVKSSLLPSQPHESPSKVIYGNPPSYSGSLMSQARRLISYGKENRKSERSERLTRVRLPPSLDSGSSEGQGIFLSQKIPLQTKQGLV